MCEKCSDITAVWIPTCMMSM